MSSASSRSCTIRKTVRETGPKDARKYQSYSRCSAARTERLHDRSQPRGDRAVDPSRRVSRGLGHRVETDEGADGLRTGDPDRLGAPDERLRGQDEALVERELALAALDPAHRGRPVADLAGHTQRRGVVEEGRRGDLLEAEVVEEQLAHRPAHRGAEPAALVLAPQPRAGLPGPGDREVLRGDPLGADHATVDDDGEVEAEVVGRERRPLAPVVR